MNWLTPWWSDFGAFVQMGKHGAYVWSAFGLCALALAGEWWGLTRQAARIRRSAALDAPQPLTPTLSPEGRGSEDPALPSDLLPLPLGEGRGEGNPR